MGGVERVESLDFVSCLTFTVCIFFQMEFNFRNWIWNWDQGTGTAK